MGAGRIPTLPLSLVVPGFSGAGTRCGDMVTGIVTPIIRCHHGATVSATELHHSPQPSPALAQPRGIGNAVWGGGFLRLSEGRQGLEATPAHGTIPLP